MTLKTYLWGMRLVTYLSVFALVLVIYNINPDEAGSAEKSIFYLVAFFVFLGLTNLFFLFLRRMALGEDSAAKTIGLSFRQSVLLALLAVTLLVMQSFRMLVWWDGLLAAAVVLLVELFFISKS